MSQITLNSVALEGTTNPAAAAVRAAMAEVAGAHTAAEKVVAQVHLKQAEDRFVKTDAALHHAQAHRTALGGMLPHHSTSYYQGVARNHLANLERTGFARPAPQVACPHVATTEERQRATITSLLGQVSNLNSRIEGLMGRLAAAGASATSSATGADPELARIANDPSLPIDQKIALFMSRLIEKSNQEIKDKMNEMSGAQQAKKSGGGFWKKLLGIGGSILGGVFGGPAGAAAGGALGATAGSAISSSGSSSPANGGQAPDTQKLQTELDLLVKKREQLITLLTNLQASLHATAMSIARNIRPA